MRNAAVDIPDYFVRANFAAGGSMQIGNGCFRNRQAFKLLLRDHVGDGPHVALNLLLRESCHCIGSLF
jgi:hypothetical protein